MERYQEGLNWWSCKHSVQSPFAAAIYPERSTLGFMLQSHKKAMAVIKDAQQRVEKAKRDRDKAKEKLKEAEARLALERARLKKGQEQLES